MPLLQVASHYLSNLFFPDLLNGIHPSFRNLILIGMCVASFIVFCCHLCLIQAFLMGIKDFCNAFSYRSEGPQWVNHKADFAKKFSQNLLL